MADTVNIAFAPSGKAGVVPKGSNILDAARLLGVDIDSVCGGRGICGRCQIEPSFGDHPKYKIKANADALSSFSDSEAFYQKKRGLDNARRLGCQCKLQGDMVIDVPPESQTHRQIIRKDLNHDHVTIDSLVKYYQIHVTQPDIKHPSGDLERIISAVANQHQINNAYVKQLSLLPAMQKLLRDHDWKISVAIRHDGEIVSFQPFSVTKAYGVAIDVGSTTMSAHLCDLSDGSVLSSVGMMNPQIRYGEDLMSRVSYSMMNKDGAQTMTNAVRASLRDLMISAARECDVQAAHILEVTLVGNPVMHHLLLGIDPIELGWAPFALASNHAHLWTAEEMDFTPAIADGARIYILPCIAGHVGADAASVILAQRPFDHDDIHLLVDVGTNAEIILGNRDHILACSSPTGPALEGAQIAFGQRAAVGAIEHVRINKDTLEPEISIIGHDGWLTHQDANRDDLPDITGICGSGIIEAICEMFLSGVIDRDGNIKEKNKEISWRIIPDDRVFSFVLWQDDKRTIKIVQNDIRAIQLAKAALYAGIQLLVDKLGKKPDKIQLAGAFGSHIAPKYAMILGLIPDCLLDNVEPIGNAAGAGARLALLNRQARADISHHVQKIEKIETATEDKFQEYFIDAMAFPHKTASYPFLSQYVALPEQSNDDTQTNQRRQRRRQRH